MVDRDDLLDDAADENAVLDTSAAEVDSQETVSNPETGADTDDMEECIGDGSVLENETEESVSDDVRNDKGDRGGWYVLKRVFLFVLSMLNPKNLFSGKMISIDLILHRWKTLLVVFCLLMFYISNRYSCQQKVARIGELRKEVEELGYRSLDMFVRLKSIQKEEAVIKAVRDSALNLHYPDIPPYIILDKDYGSK